MPKWNVIEEALEMQRVDDAKLADGTHRVIFNGDRGMAKIDFHKKTATWQLLKAHGKVMDFMTLYKSVIDDTKPAFKKFGIKTWIAVPGEGTRDVLLSYGDWTEQEDGTLRMEL